ncbi:hypothetical protein [Cupriavidus basilensis]
MPPDTPENWVRALRHAVRGGPPDLYSDPFKMTLYILDPFGAPVQTADSGSHTTFLTGWFRRFVLRDDLRERGAYVWTCFTPWCATGEKPVFITHLKSPTREVILRSPTWERAQEKHQLTVARARQVLPTLAPHAS